MKTKYAVAIREPRADENFWITVEGDNNTDVYGAFANAFDFYYGDDFNIAGILTSLKDSDALSNLAVGVTTPASDHTYHIYDAAEQTVALFDVDTDDLLVTFPLKQWVNKYPF